MTNFELIKFLLVCTTSSCNSQYISNKRTLSIFTRCKGHSKIHKIQCAQCALKQKAITLKRNWIKISHFEPSEATQKKPYESYVSTEDMLLYHAHRLPLMPVKRFICYLDLNRYHSTAQMLIPFLDIFTYSYRLCTRFVDVVCVCVQ